MSIRKRWYLLLALLLVLTLAVAGCGGSKEAEKPPADGGTSGGSAEQPAQDPRASWPANLTLGTAGTGGVYFVYGGGLGTLITEKVGIPVNIEQTGGPADNMMLVHDGAIDLGMITMGIGYEGWEGLAGTAFEGQKHDNVRAMFPMYSTYSQWWAHKDSGITSIRDLEGKKVGVGPTGGTPGTYHPLILKVLGINAEPVFGALSDLVESHADGQIDANSFASGIPLGGLLNYEATVGTENIVFFGIDGEDRDKVIAKYPYWAPTKIPADTYGFIDKDVETIEVYNWAICKKDLPDSLVYEIVDAIMTSNKELVEVHKAAVETLPENVGTNTFLPLHPGAYKWFEDNGYTVPEGARPID